uniref:G_PROTEIN_RECEP_F1_2 domain-containing protein n=1 Tax=Rhabditophanes sp. KR3021 TaxID=114890 RepID=A0AC35TVV4_9BILA
MFPMLTLYAIVFLIGFLGNLWVIISLSRILYRTWSPANSVFQHIALYILSLSIVDLLVLSMVPLLIGYFANNSWPFGYIACKIFWTVENVNKILSVAILTVMSFERLLAVARPINNINCRRFNFTTVITTLIIIAFLLNSPIIYYAETRDYQELGENGSIFDTKTICVSELPDTIMPYFIIACFFMGYILPAICIAFCYIFLIRYIRRRPRNGKIKFVSSYAKKVTRSILKVICFHFFCWSPFWIMVLIPFLRIVGIVGEFDAMYITIFKWVTSFLPYINSMGNWYFYAAMNREMRESASTIFRRSDLPTLNILINRGRAKRLLKSKNQKQLPCTDVILEDRNSIAIRTN